jgi:DNA invertase Pin-like site-specific DNA recombinase
MERLRREGCEEIFSEHASAIAVRPQFDAAMTYVRKGDVLIVTKLDRLARSVAHLCEITKTLKAKGVALRILDSNIDTGTPTGKLMIHLLGSIAEFERELMLERQRDGIAKAKREGRYKGRAPTARRRGDEVIELAKRGVSSITIADRLGIGVASVYRILAERGMKRISLAVAQ